MSTKHMGSNIEVPDLDDLQDCGGYTGFNSVNLQEIYICRRQQATRSQIARGWGKPIIQCLPNGDMLAGVFNDNRGKPNPNPNYPTAEENAALCVSHDGGMTWSEPRLLGIPGRPTQLSVLSDGLVIMMTANTHASGLHGRIYRSEDSGQTFVECPVPWEEFSRDKRPEVFRGFGETNGVQELPNGTLITTCFSIKHPWYEPQDLHAYALRSRDRGKSWGDASFIVNTDEVELLWLPEGKLLGFARLDTVYTRDVWGQVGQVGEGGDQMALMESTDGGYTWTEPKAIGLGMAQIPAFPLLLPDGRLLLIYGNRQFPWGAQAVASVDGGRTWDFENFLMLSWAGWGTPCGFPRSILMPDGSIVTGYYARYFESADASDDLVAHCLRWNVPPMWPGTNK